MIQNHLLNRPRNPVVSDFFFCLMINLLTVGLAEFEAFFNGLTDYSIDRAMACFQEGLGTRKVHPNDFDPRRAQITCHSILRMTGKGSTALGTVCNIPKFWINLEGLEQSSNLTTVETTMTRVFCMQGALKFHYWLQDIIPAAIGRTSNPTHQPKSWIDKLATDIRSSLLKGGEASFLSLNYLPNLNTAREYKMIPQRFQYDNTAQIAFILSSTLKCWLHFPPGDESMVQFELLEIILSKSPTSILFLDKIWQMFKTPFLTVFNNDWSVRRSKSKRSSALKNFEKEFSLHPFSDTSSPSHHKLQELSDLIHQWMNYTGVANPSASEIVSGIMNSTYIHLIFF